MNLKKRNEEIRDFFNNKIDIYDDVHDKFMETKALITDNLDGNINKVLDLGVGTGLELIYFFNKFPNAKVVGIDITENMLGKLENREFAKKVSTICGDFFEVDFGNEYDAVISSAALHHFLENDKIKLYKKIFECLKENGVFINLDYIAKSNQEEQQFINDYYNLKDINPHIDTPLTIEKELKLLKKVGFKKIEVKETNIDSHKLLIANK